MLKSILKIFSGNFLSKCLGLVREIITAFFYGTSLSISAFRVAQTGTFTLINFFTSDALSSTFVPKYKTLLIESRSKSQIFFWSIFILFSVLSCLIVLLLILFSDVFISLLGPGLSETTSSVAADMLRVMAIGIPTYLLSSLLIFLALANEDSTPIALRPNIQNVGMISGVLLAVFLDDVVLLAWGFTLSYSLFLLWLLNRCYRFGYLQLPNQWSKSETIAILSSFWRVLRPLLFLPFLLQGSVVAERAVASLINVTTISALDYARFVSETFIVLISVPIAFAGLTKWNSSNECELQTNLKLLLTPLLLITIPVSAFIFENSYSIISLLYQRGAFDQESLATTSDILYGLSFGLWAHIISYILIKVLNSQFRNSIVLRIMAIGLSLNIFFNLFFYDIFHSLTLGIGNSLYGLTVFFLTVSFFKIWEFILPRISLLFLGSIFYFCLMNFILPSFTTSISLIYSFFITALFWCSWVFLFPLLRRDFLISFSLFSQRLI